jgi:hypothetical protein
LFYKILMGGRKINIKKTLTLLIVTAVAACLVFVVFIYTKHNVMFWERPKNLSDKTETIEVSYIAWACDCANWLPIPRKNPDTEILDTDCIFIEPATDDLEVPDNFWSGGASQKKLKLTGNYYQTEGIPKGYEMETDLKPDKAKVFRYTKIEVVKR